MLENYNDLFDTKYFEVFRCDPDAVKTYLAACLFQFRHLVEVRGQLWKGVLRNAPSATYLKPVLPVKLVWPAEFHMLVADELMRKNKAHYESFLSHYKAEHSLLWTVTKPRYARGQYAD